MRKTSLLISFLLFSTIFLSGCTTQEVQRDVLVQEPISLDIEKQKESPPSGTKTLTEKDHSGAPQSRPTAQPSNQMNAKKMYTTLPGMTIDQTKEYSAVLRTTAGDITLNLLAKNTPITVNNFVFLAREKFYDGTIFHRTIKNFMIQGGDPTGTGMGGPGYKFADEAFTGEYTRGTLAMANAGPNTNGSQFFIMHKDVSLPKNYVIFGIVTSGMEVVDKIAEAPTKSEGEGSSPMTPISIQTIVINEK